LVNQSKPAAAIFGGSFDPPHRGHQRIVEKAAATLDIEKLLVVPAYLNPFKTSSLASAGQRLLWCQTLFDNIPKVTVDDYEIKEGKSTTTSQSVKHFNIDYDVKYLIVGSDNLSTLTEWHEFEWLNANITWVIASRKDHAMETAPLRSWSLLEITEAISSSDIREQRDIEAVDKKIENSVLQILKGQQ